MSTKDPPFQNIDKDKEEKEKSKTKLRNKFDKVIIKSNGVCYITEGIIGNGSFGVVTQAVVSDTKEVVAIKKVLQDQRFKNRELQIMKMLNHINIVQLKNSFHTSDIHVMNPYYSSFKFPEIKANPWTKVFRNKDVPAESIDLISKILHYDPSSRLKPTEICAHPFFDELRDPKTTLPDGRPLPPLFNFTIAEQLTMGSKLAKVLIPPHGMHSIEVPSPLFPTQVNSSSSSSSTPSPSPSNITLASPSNPSTSPSTSTTTTTTTTTNSN
eukprot:gene15128-17907_t